MAAPWVSVLAAELYNTPVLLAVTLQLNTAQACWLVNAVMARAGQAMLRSKIERGKSFIV
jgi:Zn-dependent alcohol dehydrogenase